ncbi:MAG: hypothetical protein HY303_03520, partial [Candidatus Wallbacteria bacterium]|nr:hypothetical protein [Candidatus Wallbacteria bacterium]
GHPRTWVFYSFDRQRKEIDGDLLLVERYWTKRGFERKFHRELAGVVLERYDRSKPGP